MKTIFRGHISHYPQHIPLLLPFSPPPLFPLPLRIRTPTTTPLPLILLQLRYTATEPPFLRPYAEGDTVLLANAFESVGDAKNGPLKPGQIGHITAVSLFLFLYLFSTHFITWV